MNVVDWRRQLVDIIELDFGLLDELSSREALEEWEVEEVRSLWKAGSRAQAIDKLLNINDANKLLECLECTGQKHLANIVRYHGGSSHC